MRTSVKASTMHIGALQRTQEIYRHFEEGVKQQRFLKIQSTVLKYVPYNNKQTNKQTKQK